MSVARWSTAVNLRLQSCHRPMNLFFPPRASSARAFYRLPLFILAFYTSCQGQQTTRSPLSTQHPNVPQSIRAPHPTLKRTQGKESGNVNDILQDKAGHLWFSTDGEGVYRYDGKRFTQFTTQDGLSDNQVSAILEAKSGLLLFGTKRGICQYDGQSWSPHAVMNTLTNQPITSLLEDRQGNLWFSTQGNGVYKYRGKTLTNFLTQDDHRFNLGAHQQLILDIHQDKTGAIWFCSWNGGGVWRYDGKAFTNFLPSADYYQTNQDGRSLPGSKPAPSPTYLPKIGSPLPPSPAPSGQLTDDMIFSISEDNAGQLWLATRRHGACRYNGQVFSSFWGNARLEGTGVYAILEDRQGRIWITTDKNGVFCYSGQTVTNYTTKEGLVHNSVFSILEDQAGNLWFGTRGFGVSRFDGKRFTTFSE